MADLNTRKVDSNKIQNGGWVGKEFGSPIPGWDDLCLRVRGYDSSTVRLARAVKMKSVKDTDYEAGIIKPDVSDRLTCETMNEVVLLEWKNLSDGGKALTHSKETQTRLIMDMDNQPLRDAVDWAALYIGSERKKVEEIIEKN